MLVFKLDTINLHYEIQGKGSKLLFIPGTASDLRQSLTIFKSPLIQDFEILSFDSRGIEQSNSSDENPTMLSFASDVKNLLDYVDWEKCFVLGESFVAMPAQEFALNDPEHVEKLILIFTSSRRKRSFSFPYHEHDISKMTLEERADFWVQCGDLLYKNPGWKKTIEYQPQYKTYLKVFELASKNLNQKQYSERQINTRKAHDTFDKLPRLKMPVYLCARKFDHIAPINNQLTLLDQILQAKLPLFNGSHGKILLFCSTRR